MSSFFITGTDTEVGKTYISTLLLKYFNQQGLSTLAMKPIASGCYKNANKLNNEDALQLQQNSSIKLAYEQVNPYAFQPAIAPHIAAELVNKKLSAADVYYSINQFLSYDSDIQLIEGAGGWQLPLNAHEVLANVIAQLKLDVILVVGMKLGCLNHAILTAQSIKALGCRLVGFITNEVTEEKMPYLDENLQSLQSLIDAPYLAHVGYNQKHVNLQYDLVEDVSDII
ncbi:MAG: dethiobiotin synthase [Gammaproteobacteria bacterium]|nr:MAG: dethiobiotin synthase [Gammaproteobacteria bacterium]UTW43471.1 dethiobiotin synthase [bacterium SCSIO 12844]